MSETTSRESGDDPFEDSTLTPERIAIVAGAMDVPVFAYLGHVLFEDLLFGALVGVLVGLGTSLFLPFFLHAEARDGLEGRDDATGGGRTGGLHRTAAGLALAPAGILLLAWRFVSADLLVGAAGVLVLVAIEYAVLSRTLPRVPR